MIKSCNSDELKFTFLTNKKINDYFETIPLDVEEITIWNYQMCLHPSLIVLKEALTIPSFERFTRLKCIRFYNERIFSIEGELPPSVQRVFFISCLMKNDRMNVCIYGSQIKRINNYRPSAIEARPMLLLSLMEKPKKRESMRTINASRPRPSVSQRSMSSLGIGTGRRTRRSKSLWRIMEGMFKSSWFFRPTYSKISPQKEKEIEMVEIIPLNTTFIDGSHIKDLIQYRHSLESINRFKKIYDLLVNENLVAYLTDNL